MLNIVLVEPEIPQNTGNIIRSCAATGTTLHLVRPLGFSFDDKHLKRSGLDYHDLANIKFYVSFDEVVKNNPEGKFFFSTTKVNQSHSDVKFVENSFIVFGKETKGLPKEIIENSLETCIRIPMIDDERARSLNLSNSVAIVLYEALRQLKYPNMK